MRTLLVIAALGWIISLPWATLFAYFALIVIAIVVMWFLSVSIERRAVARCSGGNTIDANYVTALENMVVEAEAEVEKLRGEIERLRSAAAAPGPDLRTALYRRVGLCENAPEWLVAAARRAYRAELHPDRHPAHRKQEAENRFKLAESVFEAIAAQRASA